MSDSACDTLPEAERARRRLLPPAAQRALAEADARRQAGPELTLPKEFGGRHGPEPVRYGDYERKGLAVDF